MLEHEHLARGAIVAEAQKWLRTPWRHRARVLGAGVDCGQLLIAAYAGAGITPEFDTGDYPQDWMKHRNEERFLGWVHQYAREIDRERARAGDLVVMRIGRTYSHGGIVLDEHRLIHAVVNRCVEIGEFEEYRTHPMRFFSVFKD